MNLFNLFNCRRLSSLLNPEINVFAQFTKSWMLFSIFLAGVVFMYMIYSFSWIGFIFGVTWFDRQMHFVSLSLGLGSIVVGVAVKMTP